MTRPGSVDVIAVLTLEYSGSTILAMAAASHPRVVTLGEGQKLYWKAIRKIRYDAPPGAHDCSCGAPFATCPFWQGIAARVQQHVPPRIAALDFPGFRLFHRDRVHAWALRRCLRSAAARRTERLPPILRGRYRAVAAANAVLVDAARELGEADVYLDTGKNPAATALLATSPLREGRLVHLIRDGRGQVLSTLRHRPELDFDGACRRWVETTERQLEILRMFGDRVETVRYEELCADPGGTLARVWALAGLAPPEGGLDLFRAPRHVMGNRGVRFAAVSEIRDRQEWRERLTAAQLATFERIAGRLHHELGYE